MKKIELIRGKSVFIIAEAGVNHDGNMKNAKKLIDIAVFAKADAVKFQTFKPGECTGKFAFKVAYQARASDSSELRYEMSKRLALPYKDFIALQKYAKNKGILFLSTPDGYDSLDFVINRLNLPVIKISSTEITHLDFLKAAAKKGRPIILSTGMSNLSEVKTAVNIIRVCHKNKKELVLLHCTSEYPAPYNEVNLRAMVTLGKIFNVPVGYSDHTLGKETAIAAVALGAKIIEKHFTISKMLCGPDHKASMEPEELKDFIHSIRITERILGDGIKKPAPCELKNISGVRRGIVAARLLKKGIVLKKNMLTFKRPNTGIQPPEINKVIGRILKRDLEEDEVLQWEDLK